MPITEWVCQKCGTRFEVLTYGATPEKPVCEECGSRDVEKQLSRFSASGAPEGSPSSRGGCAPGRGFT